MKTYTRYEITYKDGKTATCTLDWLLALTNRRSIKKVVIFEVDGAWNQRKIKTIHTKKEIREIIMAGEK